MPDKFDNNKKVTILLHSFRACYNTMENQRGRVHKAVKTGFTLTFLKPHLNFKCELHGGISYEKLDEARKYKTGNLKIR